METTGLIDYKKEKMKTVFVVILIAGAFSVKAQSLKEALYSGKLKSDSVKVLRKSDDWASKIDTGTHKPVDSMKTKAMLVARDSSGQGMMVQTDSTSIATASPENNIPVAKESVAAPKDNNKIWKDFTDEFSKTLKTEMLPSKKIKNGTYSVLIEYEIGVDGQISVRNVSCSPENSFIEQQVKERLQMTAPQMVPLLNNYGKPRTAVKKYTLILTK